MSGFLADSVRDNGLGHITGATGLKLLICDKLPADKTAAEGADNLGTKDPPTIGAPADGSPNGRSVTVSAISDGSIDTSGTATHWAITDNTELLASEALSAPQGVTTPNVFTLGAFDINLPDQP